MDIQQKDERYNIYKQNNKEKKLINENVTHIEVEDYIVNEVTEYLMKNLPKQRVLNLNTARSCKKELQNIKSLHKYKQNLGDFSIIILAVEND
jgi:hypothetical protein